MSLSPKAAAKWLAAKLGLEIHRKVAAAPSRAYLDAQAIIDAAAAAGQSVGEYLRDKEGYGDAVKRFVERAHALGINAPKRPHILEIGPGTGRVAEEIIARYGPKTYEIYETDAIWSDYLARSLPALARPTDGHTLQATGAATVDMVWAFGVFVYIPFIISSEYWRECARVIKPGGWLICDVITETCMTPDIVSKWIAIGHTFPTLIGKAYVIEIMSGLGFSSVGSFQRSYDVGESEMFVFRRRAD